MESGGSLAAILLVALIFLVMSILWGAPRGLSRRSGTLLLALSGVVLFSIATLLRR